MEEKLKYVNKMKKDSGVAQRVKDKLAEFSAFKDKPNEEWFSELCFCLMTANASAKGGIAAQKHLGAKGFLILSQEELSKKLVEARYRFPNVRAKYIFEARKHADGFKRRMQSLASFPAREWLVENVKGLGMKEASHFLRNVGRTDLAILDKHIIRSLGHELKPLNKNRYLEIEKQLIKMGNLTNTNMAELDLILWYSQTGEILK